MADRTVSVRLMAEVGQYVSGMNKAAGATVRLGESASASSTKARSGFDIAGKGALLMGAAVVGGLGMAVGKSMEFERAMSAVQSATGATVSTMGDLRAAAMKYGADTQYSATEAANAITEMAKAGVSAKDIMGGGLSGALSLAAAGQIEVADAAGIASTAMTQFSLSGEQLPHVADLLAAGAGKAMGGVDDLGQALNQAGLVAAATGISIEETTGTLSAFASAGLLGSDAGTSLKTMLQKLQAPSKEAAGIMSDLGISTYDASGNFVGLQDLAGQLQNKLSGLTQAQRDNALATIFGSDAVRAANVLYSQGSDGIAEWTAKVNDAGYAQKQAAALTDNLSGDLERLGGAFDTLLINVGSGAQGPLRDVVQLLTHLVDGVSWAVDSFGSLPGPVQAAVGALLAVKLLGGPLNSMMDVLAPKITGLATGMGMAAKSAGGFSGALSGVLGMINPVTVGVGLVAAALSQYASDSAAVEARMATATDAGESFRSTLADQGNQLNETSLAAADLATKTAGLTEAFDKAGISSRDVAKGLAGDTRAYKDMLQAARDLDEQAAWAATGGFWGLTGLSMDAASGKLTANADAVENLVGKLRAGKVDAGGWGDSVKAAAEEADRAARGSIPFMGEAVALTDEQFEAAKKAVEDWRKELQTVNGEFVNVLGTYKGLLDEKNQAERAAAEKTAAATSSGSDSWKDYVGDVSVSLDELATKLEEQLAAQDNWRANIVTITQRGGLEVGQAIAAMGEEGVQLAAQMANGTDAEFQRMAGLIVRDAQNGGAEAAAALDTQMKVMAAIGAAGASATATGIAQQLNLGVSQVADIAARYGVALASGINPVLAGIGKQVINLNQKPGRTYLGVSEYADGGYTGPGGKYTPAGVVHKGEFVFPQEAVNRIGVGTLGAMAGLPGYAGGGFVTAADVPKPYSTAPAQFPISTAAAGTMQKGYDGVVAMLAEQMAAGGGPAGASVQRWLPLVLRALGMVGQPASLAQTVLRRMQQESGGNPMAINNWDINAKRGTPSKGLMQTIDPTFRAYAMPGYSSNVYDPLSNILASMRYALARYGSLSAAYNKAGGYANGGTTPAGDPFWVGENGPELMWSSKSKYVSSATQSREFSGGSGGSRSSAPVVVNVEGARIAGTFEIGGDGLGRIIDGRIVQAVTSVNDGLYAALGARS